MSVYIVLTFGRLVGLAIIFFLFSIEKTGTFFVLLETYLSKRKALVCNVAALPRILS